MMLTSNIDDCNAKQINERLRLNPQNVPKKNVRSQLGDHPLGWPLLWRITMNSLHNEGIYE